jgi:repressor LexA
MHALALTDREQEVLDWIAEFMFARRHPPAHRDIQKEFGFRSRRSVEYYVGRLKAKGYLDLTPGLSRTLRLHGECAYCQPRKRQAS